MKKLMPYIILTALQVLPIIAQAGNLGVRGETWSLPRVFTPVTNHRPNSASAKAAYEATKAMGKIPTPKSVKKPTWTLPITLDEDAKPHQRKVTFQSMPLQGYILLLASGKPSEAAWAKYGKISTMVLLYPSQGDLSYLEKSNASKVTFLPPDSLLKALQVQSVPAFIKIQGHKGMITEWQ